MSLSRNIRDRLAFQLRQVETEIQNENGALILDDQTIAIILYRIKRWCDKHMMYNWPLYNRAVQGMHEANIARIELRNEDRIRDFFDAIVLYIETNIQGLAGNLPVDPTGVLELLSMLQKDTYPEIL